MAKAGNKSSTLTRILLNKALALLSKHHPPHIAWEILVREIAARHVRYWPDDPDLAAVWKKLSGENNPQIQFFRHERDWVEFHINNVRRTIYPIQVALEDLLALLPAQPAATGTTPRTQRQRTLAKTALDELHPGGVPDSVSTETARAEVEAWCKCKISRDTVARALKRRS
jgi:hypothetical protein